MVRTSKLETWMWARAQRALQETARIQQQFCTLVATARVPSWSPPVDLFEIEDGLYLMMVAPGVRPEQVEVELTEGLLRIAAPRALPDGLRGSRVLHMEIPLGYFERTIRLPRGRFRVGDVALRDGLLHLRLRCEGGC